MLLQGTWTCYHLLCFAKRHLLMLASHGRRLYGECFEGIPHPIWDPPARKNQVKTDLGRGLLPGETYSLYPRRRRFSAVGSAIVRISGFGVGLNSPRTIDLKMYHEN